MRPAAGPFATALALLLAGCTVTYGPDDPPPEPTLPEEPVCAAGDTSPACATTNPICQDPGDDACLGPAGTAPPTGPRASFG